MRQQGLFDRSESERRKEAGMEAAEYGGFHNTRKEALEAARSLAKLLAVSTPDRTTNADEVGIAYHRKYGEDMATALGPACGSLFRGKEWGWTGRRIQSRRVTNHSRELKVWRLK